MALMLEVQTLRGKVFRVAKSTAGTPPQAVAPVTGTAFVAWHDTGQPMTDRGCRSCPRAVQQTLKQGIEHVGGMPLNDQSDHWTVPLICSQLLEFSIRLRHLAGLPMNFIVGSLPPASVLKSISRLQQTAVADRRRWESPLDALIMCSSA